MTLSVKFYETGTKQRKGPILTGNEEGFTSTRYLQFKAKDINPSGNPPVITGDDIIKFRWQILGYPHRTGAAVLSRKLPEHDPEDLNSWAVSAVVEELAGARGYRTITVDGQPRNVPCWDTITFRVDYAWRPFDVHADADLDANGEYGRYVEVQEDGQADILTSAVLNSILKWAAPGIASINGIDAAPLGIQKIIPYANVTIIWHQVPFIYYPRDAIRNSLGKVSKEDLGAPTDRNYYAKGTLLFLGVRRRRYAHCHPESTGIGQAVVDLQYYFRHDPGGNEDIAAGNLGPNTFPCFSPATTAANAPPLNKRVLVTTDGLYYNIGSRDTKCVFDEFDPRDLFKVE